MPAMRLGYHENECGFLFTLLPPSALDEFLCFPSQTTCAGLTSEGGPDCNDMFWGGIQEHSLAAQRSEPNAV